VFCKVIKITLLVAAVGGERDYEVLKEGYLTRVKPRRDVFGGVETDSGEGEVERLSLGGCML
jgi:hypothetical protein